MNINKFTIKSQEAIPFTAISSRLRQQQIENEHLFKAMLEVDENVTPFC
jgi:ATP-dependent Clp protease ATP-binding subunit ClpB